jgi:hypothetical protein
MTGNKYWRDYTNYPKIYKDCYWGYFQSEIKNEILEHEPCKEIAKKNRNEFITKYNIIKSTNNIHRLIELNFLNRINYKVDHLESYKTRDNKIIILSSPYMIKETDKDYDNYIKKGWKKYLNFITILILHFYYHFI